MKLYDITSEVKQLEKLVEDGELTREQVQDTLDGSELEFQEKATNIVNLASSWEDDIATIDNHIKRLQARKKSIKGNADRLREYLRYNMIESGVTKIQSPLFTIQLRKGVQKVNILDADLLPEEYVNAKVEIKPDSRKILKDLKEGVEITGALIEQGADTLLIK